VSTLAQSYLDASSHLAGGATSQKEAKYTSLSLSFLFQPVAFETLDLVAPFSSAFSCEVGRRLNVATSDAPEMVYLFQ